MGAIRGFEISLDLPQVAVPFQRNVVSQFNSPRRRLEELSICHAVYIRGDMSYINYIHSEDIE